MVSPLCGLKGFYTLGFVIVTALELNCAQPVQLSFGRAC